MKKGKITLIALKKVFMVLSLACERASTFLDCGFDAGLHASHSGLIVRVLASKLSHARVELPSSSQGGPRR
eukprot:1315277-Amorphochlora_amoeboformis.AAC.1